MADQEHVIYLDLELHTGQIEVYESLARFRVLCCGRRWGKSIVCRAAILDGVTKGQKVAYMCPTNKMLGEMWRAIKALLAPITEEKNEQEHRIQTINGAVVEMWSLDNPDGPRGREYDLVIIDEAGVIPSGDPWQEVIRPTLMSTHGRALFASTPKGYNWFWGLFRLGQSSLEPDWACWHKPTVDNPHIDPQEIEDARRTTPVNIFSQEYLANFISDSGSVFRKLDEAAIAPQQNEPKLGHVYIIGVDLAKTNDFSVYTVIDATAKAVAFIDRANHVDYSLQKERLVSLTNRYHAAAVIVEQNTNLAFMEQLVDTGLPIYPFVTSGPTKALIIESLAAAFDNEELLLLDPQHDFAQEMLNELRAFQMERLPSGAFRYGGPRDTHDDIVMSLALAYYGATFDVPTWSPEIIGMDDPVSRSIPDAALIEAVIANTPDEVVPWPTSAWTYQ